MLPSEQAGLEVLYPSERRSATTRLALIDKLEESETWHSSEIY